MLPPLTPTNLLTSWIFDPLGAALTVALADLYSVLLVCARSLGARWHRLRSAAFLIAGIGSLLYATCGALAVYRSSLFRVAAVQAAVLSSATPVGVSLGDPVALAGKGLADRSARRLRRGLAGSLPAS